MHACFGGNLFGSGVEYFLAVPGACSFLDDDNRVQYDVMAGGLTFSPSPLCEISTKFAPVTKTKIPCRQRPRQTKSRIYYNACSISTQNRSVCTQITRHS